MPFMDVFKNMDSRELETAAPATHGADYVSPSKAKGAYMAKISGYKDSVIRDFYQRGTGLNNSIANIATQEGLNHNQLSRLIEEVNCDVYLEEYSKTKNNSVRDVKFEIASMTKIKDLMNPKDSQELEKTQDDPRLKAIKGGGKGIMKRAFTEDTFEGDKLNMFNYTAYETCGLAPEADKDIDPNSFTINKIAKELDSLNLEIKRETDELYDCYSGLANSLVKMARTEDVQAKFEHICKEAQFQIEHQVALIDLVNEKVANYRELGYIAPSEEIKLNIVENIEKDRDFSLGEHSLYKKAAESTAPIVTNRGMIKDINNLITLAEKIEVKQKKLQSKQEKRNGLTNKIQ